MSLKKKRDGGNLEIFEISRNRKIIIPILLTSNFYYQSVRDITMLPSAGAVWHQIQLISFSFDRDIRLFLMQSVAAYSASNTDSYEPQVAVRLASKV